jgi:soluble lytic murein transglycosylase-like protein
MLPGRARIWLAFVEESAKRHGLDPLFVLAIMDHESLCGYTLQPMGPEGVGDGGHGRGLMQIDDRFHHSFIAQTDADGTPLWKKPAANIEYACEFLGKLSRSIPFPAGIPGAREACLAAAYNAGLRGVCRVLSSLEEDSDFAALVARLDSITTHKDYVADVTERKRRFLLPAHKSSPPPPKPEGVV